MPRQRKKPNYQHADGEYSSSPSVRERDDGTYEAHGDIEAWRGSVADLAHAGESAMDALSEVASGRAGVAVSCTDSSGQHQQFGSLDEFEAQASALPDSEIGSVRIEIREDDSGTTGSIVARRTMPGILVTAQGPSRIEVSGLATLLYRSVLPGYIDRYGNPLRWLAAVAITALPGIATYALVVSRWEAWPNALVLLIAAAGLAITVWTLGKGWEWTLYRTPLEFVPDEVPPPANRVGQAKAVLARPWVARIVGVTGVLILGIVANKLSDLIHWP